MEKYRRSDEKGYFRVRRLIRYVVAHILGINSVTADQRSTFFITNADAPASEADSKAVNTPSDPNESQYSKDKGADANETLVLVGVDRPEREGDGDRGGKISFWGREGIRCRCSFKEEPTRG